MDTSQKTNCHHTAGHLEHPGPYRHIGLDIRHYRHWAWANSQLLSLEASFLKRALIIKSVVAPLRSKE